jgi:hypothetical protein
VKALLPLLVFAFCACQTFVQEKIETEIEKPQIKYGKLKLKWVCHPHEREVLLIFSREVYKQWRENKVKNYYQIHHHSLFSTYTIVENKPESSLIVFILGLTPVSLLAGGELTSIGKAVRSVGLILLGGLVIYEAGMYIFSPEQRPIVCDGHLIKKVILETKTKTQKLKPLFLSNFPVEVKIGEKLLTFKTNLHGVVRIPYMFLPFEQRQICIEVKVKLEKIYKKTIKIPVEKLK